MSSALRHRSSSDGSRPLSSALRHRSGSDGSKSDDSSYLNRSAIISSDGSKSEDGSYLNGSASSLSAPSSSACSSSTFVSPGVRAFSSNIPFSSISASSSLSECNSSTFAFLCEWISSSSSFSAPSSSMTFASIGRSGGFVPGVGAGSAPEIGAGSSPGIGAGSSPRIGAPWLSVPFSSISASSGLITP